MEVKVIVIISFNLAECSYYTPASSCIDSQWFIFEDNKLFLMKRWKRTNFLGQRERKGGVIEDEEKMNMAK